MICAGEDSDMKDTCQNDSGGPIVVVDNKQKHLLLGVTSWGIGCGDIGIYWRVQNYIEWIKDSVRLN